MAGFSGFGFEVGSAGSVDRVPGALVTGRFYQTLGVNPSLDACSRGKTMSLERHWWP